VRGSPPQRHLRHTEHSTVVVATLSAKWAGHPRERRPASWCTPPRRRWCRTRTAC